VSLNAGSCLVVPEQFNKLDRGVVLEGEAFFDVARNEQMPFIVRIGDAMALVLGTQFNVRAWDGSVQVVVEKGEVELRRASDTTGVLIQTGEMSEVTRMHELRQPRSVNVGYYTAWRYGRLAFNDMPVPELLAEIERRYDVRCVVTDSTYNSKRITGYFLEASLDDFLHNIALALDLHVRHRGRNVTFY